MSPAAKRPRTEEELREFGRCLKLIAPSANVYAVGMDVLEELRRLRLENEELRRKLSDKPNWGHEVIK